MGNYKPATLIEMFADGPSSYEIIGESHVVIFRNDSGGTEASGTFISKDEKLQGFKRLSGKLFHYEGPAFEADYQYEIRATMSVKRDHDDIYRLETIEGFLTVNS